MSCYEQTKQKLQQIPNIQIIDHPLIWFKTDGAMIAPGAQTRLYPKHAYETAFLCIRGKRPLIKVLSNTYAAPHTSKPIHPSQKPEPVLNHFFQMFVDETTDVFDPTCGSGASIRSAITTGARSTTGLEIDPNFFELADRETTKFHNLRKFLGR